MGEAWSHEGEQSKLIIATQNSADLIVVLLMGR